MHRLVVNAAALFAVIPVAAVLTSVSTAQALPPDGCPGGFVRFAVVPGLEFVDENGDGWICGKDLPRSPFGGLVVDNKTRT